MCPYNKSQGRTFPFCGIGYGRSAISPASLSFTQLDNRGLLRKREIGKKINSAVFPGLQGPESALKSDTRNRASSW
jgi:hypothetical protein